MNKIMFLGGETSGYKCLRCLCEEHEIEVALVISNTSDLYGGENGWYTNIHKWQNAMPLFLQPINQILRI